MEKVTKVEIYDYISKNETFFSFIIYYVKVAFVHSFLEIVITLFTIDALIAYSDFMLPNKKNVIDSEFMGYFFSSTLLGCGLIFFIYCLCFGVFFKKTLIEIIGHDDKTQQRICKKFCYKIIIVGLISYTVVGAIAACGIGFLVRDCIVLTGEISMMSRVKIAIAITICGVSWAFTSLTRIWRVDWDRLHDLSIETQSENNNFRDKRINAIIYNVFAQLGLIIFLAYEFVSSILTNIDSEYINTYLTLYFSIMSAYIVLYYILEFKKCHFLFGRIDNL